jgi:predicted DNA binding CopG/RHH family protein
MKQSRLFEFRLGPPRQRFGQLEIQKVAVNLNMRAIANWEEVPLFDSEDAEASFWAEHKPDLRLLESSVAGASDSAESVNITLRIDPRMLARIKRLARSRYLNYQSMIKQWLSERMEEELRER